MVIKDNLREILVPFFESPDREMFRELLKGCIGEFNHIDFKEKWLDCPKLAKHILGMANNRGGAIIFGVSEDTSGVAIPVGLDKVLDKTQIKNKLAKFIPERLGYEIADFTYVASDWGALNGKKFQVIMVDDAPEHIPFLSLSDGKEICRNRIYYRGFTNTDEATYEQIQELLSRRVDTQHSITSDELFKSDLFQLKELYKQIPRTITTAPNFFSLSENLSKMLGTQTKQNPDHPEESFADFINKMIILKKRIIESAVKGREFVP